MIKRGIFLLLSLYLCHSFAQGKTTAIDSLKARLISNTDASEKISILIALSAEYSYQDPDSGILFSNKAIDEARRTGNEKQLPEAYKSLGVNYYMLNDYTYAMKNYLTALKMAQTAGDEATTAKVLGNIGLIYYEQVDYFNALEHYNKALEIDKEAGNKKGISLHLGNIGLVHWQQGDYPKALSYFFDALKIDEELGNKKGIARHLGNIGLIHWNQHNNKEALNYFNKALILDKELGNKNGMARHYGNMGIVYDEMHDLTNAELYYFKALELDVALENREGIARHLGNLGSVFNNKKEYEVAMDHFTQALKIATAIGKAELEAENLMNIGGIYAKQKKYDEATTYLLRSRAISDSLGLMEKKMNAEYSLFNIYSETGQWKEAVEFLSSYMSTKDSVFNIEKSNQVGKMEARQEYQKQEAIAQLTREAEKKLQNIIITAVSIGLVLVIIFSIFMYNRFLESRKQAKIIEKQKEQVEEKNRETMESIRYAKRFQKAISPPRKYVDLLLNDHFVLYKPKDIISGDFYWVEKANDMVFFAVGDCTGHGVPGALVSIMCGNALTKAAKEHALTKPSEILDKTVDLLEEIFSKSEEEIQDGMDIALCCYSANEKKMYYAGANNPLYHIRNKELFEIKADKQPVGKYIQRKPYTTHTINIEPGDCFYVFSDGYADQFGGPDGKKFKYKAFKQLLLDIHQRSLYTQREVLNTVMEEWKGELEQVDDICIFGVRV